MDNGNSIIIYDGSFEGLLTVVFTTFEQKLQVTGIYRTKEIQQDFYSKPEEVITDIAKAERVKDGLLKKISPAGVKQLYYAFLSELREIEFNIYQYCYQAFTCPNFSSRDFGNPVVLEIAQTAKKVSREKHRMEAFVRFKLTRDNLFFAEVEPDFNVLPIILPHFESRYADQKWIIYDKRRKFGIYYDLETTSFIKFERLEIEKTKGENKEIYADAEIEFETLWQNYFNSVNIKSRKNTKLHIKHVPKRYWKYLSEKSPLVN